MPFDGACATGRDVEHLSPESVGEGIFFQFEKKNLLIFVLSLVILDDEERERLIFLLSLVIKKRESFYFFSYLQSLWIDPLSYPRESERNILVKILE